MADRAWEEVLKLAAEDAIPSASTLKQSVDGRDVTPGALSHFPRSFTFFVLPFAWSLSPAQGTSVSSARYEPESPPDLRERLRYLTAETRLTLFDRTRWLRLRTPGGPEGFEWKSFGAQFADRRTLQVAVERPWLVLFECTADRVRGARAKPTPDLESPLCTGFLIVPTHLAAVRDPGPVASPTLLDLLEFNERFRFLERHYDDHAAARRDMLGKYPCGDSTIGDIEDADPADTSASYRLLWQEMLEYPAQLEPGGPLFRVIRSEPSKPSTNGEWPPWHVHSDNRAFVWTCATLADDSLDPLRPGQAAPVASGWWVKLLNVDEPPAVTSDVVAEGARITAFERDWIDRHTYRRWLEGGHLYGFCHHGGAHLRGTDRGAPATHRHFATMYLDQILLLLYLRTTTFRLSLSLARTSARAADRPEDDRAFASSIMRLRRDLALVTNLYRYPLLSNQQQGIELYELARDALDVDPLFMEVHEQLKTTDDFLTSREQTTLSHAANRLGQIAMYAGVAGLVIALHQIPADPWVAAVQRILLPDHALTSISLFLCLLLGTLLARVLWSRMTRRR